MSAQTQTEIKSWLETILAKENLSNISVTVLGHSEKGDGFLGDIVFVNCTATTPSNQRKEFELVLKCSKKSKAFRENSPVKEAFHNEIYLYTDVFPYFLKFQREKNVKNVFESVPKFYGYFTNDDSEIIALENLKKKGYDLWEKNKSVTWKHVQMVVREYGKYHAISVALQDQKPQEFKKLGSRLQDLMKEFVKQTSIIKAYRGSIGQACDVLRGTCDEKYVEKWNHLGETQLEYIFGSMRDEECLKVISHGDYWSNNFMWKHTEQSKGMIPEKVAIIDWQISFLTSPVLDLSYFLFTCMANEDLTRFDEILDLYHDSLSQNVRDLGSDPEKLYPKSEFLRDWQKYARHGIAMVSVAVKMTFCNQEDIPDMAKSLEEGKDVSDEFVKFTVNNPEGFRNRIAPIIKYVVDHDLI